MVEIIIFNKHNILQVAEVNHTGYLVSGHSYGDASVFALLTPKRDYEVVVISRAPCLDFYRLVFFTLHISHLL